MVSISLFPIELLHAIALISTLYYIYERIHSCSHCIYYFMHRQTIYRQTIKCTIIVKKLIMKYAWPEITIFIY